MLHIGKEAMWRRFAKLVCGKILELIKEDQEEMGKLEVQKAKLLENIQALDGQEGSEAW